MNFLITGGSGFLASRLANYLSAHGHRVSVASRREIVFLNGVDLRLMDWDSPENLQNCCADTDVVIHTAALNAHECAADPEQAYQVNAILTSRLLSAAASMKVRQFQYFSTAHVYRAPLTGMITEADRTENNHPYAASHRAAEDLVHYHCQKAGMQGIVFRLSNAFGPPIHKFANCWMLVFNDLCREAVTQNSLTLKSAKQRRDFITLTDTTRASEFAAGLQQSGTFNLGGEWAPTIEEIANLIRERCGILFDTRPEIRISPDSRNDFGGKLEYSIEKFRNQGFNPGRERIQEMDSLLLFCHENFR